MNLNQSRKVLAAFGKGIDTSHHRFGSLEDADAIAHDATDDAVVFPLLQDLCFQRFLSRVKSLPDVVDRFGSTAFVQGRQRFFIGRVAWVGNA